MKLISSRSPQRYRHELVQAEVLLSPDRTKILLTLTVDDHAAIFDRDGTPLEFALSPSAANKVGKALRQTVKEYLIADIAS